MLSYAGLHVCWFKLGQMTEESLWVRLCEEKYAQATMGHDGRASVSNVRTAIRAAIYRRERLRFT